MGKDSKLIGLIEDLYGRSKGIKATWERVERLSIDALGAIGNVANITALRSVQGVNVPANDYHTTMEYLDAIWRKLNNQGGGTASVPRTPQRRVILPGDPTNFLLWSNTGAGATFPSTTGVGITSQQQYFQTSAPAPPFSIDRGFINFYGLDGAVQTAEHWAFGYVKEDAQIVELNANFVLPTAFGRAATLYQHGFGMVNMPLTETHAVGIWIEPVLNGGGNNWISPYPFTVYVAKGDGSPTAYSVADMGVPASDTYPGSVAISWNRYRIAVYLSRGSRGLSTSATIPRYWLYPQAPNAWPYPWPYNQQTVLFQVGNPTYYPGITSGIIPSPVSVAATWNPFYIALREIDIEETPIFPGTPLAGAIDPRVLKIEA